MAAKVRPCLIVTPPPTANDLDVYTIIAHTTAVRGSRWEMSIPKSFLHSEGAFDVQRVATVPSVKLERRRGVLSEQEVASVLDLLAQRLNL
jgi:mRNA interferase MazF